MEFNERFITAAKLVHDFIRRNGQLNYSRIAKALSKSKSVSRQSVKNWATGVAKTMDAELASIFCEITGVNEKWLVRGIGEMQSFFTRKPEFSHIPDLPSNAGDRIIRYFHQRERNSRSINELGVEEPRGENHGVQGNKAVEYMRLTDAWLRRNTPDCDPDYLFVVAVVDDSMSPTYGDGDVLLVNTAIHSLDADSVYVLNFKDRVHIKRVQKLPNGVWRMKSDNPLYDPYDFTVEDLQELKVDGRVVYAWHGKKI